MSSDQVCGILKINKKKKNRIIIILRRKCSYEFRLMEYNIECNSWQPFRSDGYFHGVPVAFSTDSQTIKIICTESHEFWPQKVHYLSIDENASHPVINKELDTSTYSVSLGLNYVITQNNLHILGYRSTNIHASTKLTDNIQSQLMPTNFKHNAYFTGNFPEHAAVIHCPKQECIYLIGGFNFVPGGGTPDTGISKYDIQNKKWTKLSVSFPYCNVAVSLTSDETHVIIAGGTFISNKNDGTFSLLDSRKVFKLITPHQSLKDEQLIEYKEVSLPSPGKCFIAAVRNKGQSEFIVAGWFNRLSKKMKLQHATCMFEKLVLCYYDGDTIYWVNNNQQKSMRCILI